MEGDDKSSEEQKLLIQSLKTKGIIKSERVEETMLSIDRRLFPAINSYEDDYKSVGFGLTINSPELQAHVLELLNEYLFEGANVLDVASGNGYFTVCMAKIIGSTGQVVGIDYVERLTRASKQIVDQNFPHFNDPQTVMFVKGDGSKGFMPSAPYDVINIGASVDDIPEAILNQLKHGGRIVAVVGPPDGNKYLVSVDKLDSGSIAKIVQMKVDLQPTVDTQKNASVNAEK